MTDISVRSRTITWDDPLIGAQMAMRMGGLEFLQAMRRGEVPAPPIAVLMGMEMIELKEGRIVFAFEPGEYHYNPIGVVHGGVASTILDTVMACAIHTMLPAGTGYTTLELKVNFVRPITLQTGKVSAIGEVIHVGKSVATAQGRVVDANDKLLGHATTTCMIMRGDK